MIGRGSRVLVLGACSALGEAIARAALALGCEVLAADRLRTRLEELRAALGQHERLHVAEWDATDVAGTRKLIADKARDGALDAVWFVVRDMGGVEAVAGAVVAALAPAGPGRLALLAEGSLRGQLDALCSRLGLRAIAETVAPDSDPGAQLPELLLLGHPPLLRVQNSAAPRALLVGDVHGCAGELDDLLAASGFSRGDLLVMVGDLVAKGPDSRGVLRRLREVGAVAVRGNHDERLLRQRAALARGEQPQSLRPQHQSVFDALDADDWAQLEALPLWLQLEPFDTLVVHAGRVPGLPLPEHDPDLLLNMRTVDAQGAGSRKPDAGVLWGSLWPGPELIVFGHHAMQGLQLHAHAVGLDTGCVYGGRLTGLWLPERRLVSVPARAEYVPRGE